MIKNFEQSIKEKLTEFQYPYDNQSWKNFAKKLPKSPFYQSKIFIASSVVAFIVAAVFIFYNLKSDTQNQSNHLTTNKQITEVDFNVNETQNSTNVKINAVIENESSETSTDTLENKNNDQIIINSVSVNETENKKNVFSVFSIIDNINIFDSVTSVPLALFNVSPVEGCLPLSVKISPLEISDTIIYLWEFGDGNNSDETNPVHIYSEAGDYNILLKAKYRNSEKFSVSSQMISVFEKPVADFEWKNDDNHYQFVNISINASTYLWNFNYKQLSSETYEPQINFDTEGKYLVSLVAMNENGCMDTVIKTVFVEFVSTLFMPDAFSPNGDGVCDLFGPEGVGLDCSEYLMNIYDGYGKLVFSTKNQNEKWNGNLLNTEKKLGVGTYFWEYFIKNSIGQTISKNGRVKLFND